MLLHLMRFTRCELPRSQHLNRCAGEWKSKQREPVYCIKLNKQECFGKILVDSIKSHVQHLRTYLVIQFASSIKYLHMSNWNRKCDKNCSISKVTQTNLECKNHFFLLLFTVLNRGRLHFYLQNYCTNALEKIKY